MPETGNANTGLKRCFVIAPIGEAGSAIRRRSDQVFRHVIMPAALECGYPKDNILRSDMEDTPGLIGSQIINHIVEDDLVIADLTEHNPNVFYELALRHAVQKPIVQLIEEGKRIPFDVNQVRTLSINHQDLDSAMECRTALVRAIRAAEKDPTLVDSPISQAITVKALAQSPKTEDQRFAALLESLASLSRKVDQIAARLPQPEYEDYQGTFIRYLLDRYASEPSASWKTMNEQLDDRLGNLRSNPAVNLESRRDYLRGLYDREAAARGLDLSEESINRLVSALDARIPSSLYAARFRSDAEREMRRALDAMFPSMDGET